MHMGAAGRDLTQLTYCYHMLCVFVVRLCVPVFASVTCYCLLWINLLQVPPYLCLRQQPWRPLHLEDGCD